MPYVPVVYPIPEGYEPAPWAELRFGSEVYEVGIRDGQVHPYGPFTVVDLKERRLMNAAGRTFRSWPDDLVRRVVTLEEPGR